MTTPTITFGHGILDDCHSTSGWGETEVSLVAALTCLHGDVLKIEGTCNDSGNEWVQYAKDITANKFSGGTFPNFLIRWKTSVSSNGLGANVSVGYEGGGGEDILGTPTIPLFDTSWHLTTGELSATGKTKNIVTLAIHADDYPDSIDSGTFQVYYDFILFYKNTFTLPNVGYGLEFSPPPKYAVIPIFGRVGDVTQGGGSESATVRCSCDLDIGTWKRLIANGYSADDYVDAEVFYEIAHRTYTEPWQWLDTGLEQFKVTLETPVFRRSVVGNKSSHILDLLWREYRLGCASDESYVERFGLNL